MTTFINDLRYALRSLRRSVFFASMTVLTLGVGIGVITALFAVVDAVLLRPMAPDQDRVVRIWRYDIERALDRVQLSYVEFKAWREASRSFEALAAIQYANASTVAITIDSEPTPVDVTPVSADFFRIMHGDNPLYGRWFEAADEVKGAPLVTVVSERFWRQAAGGDPNFVGRRVTLAGSDVALLVVGIAPAALDYPLGTDLWMPIHGFYERLSTPAFDSENPNFAQFHVVGRLSRGTSLEQAEAELTVLHRQWMGDPSNNRNNRPPLRVVMVPLLNAAVGNLRQVLLFLFAASGLVFVIAGVNVAALLLMRASARTRELAVRVALGASHGRLTRQTLTEGLVLGVLGALCGALFALLLLGTAQSLAPEEIPRIEQAAIDLRVLGFCAVAALMWVLTFGTVPSWGRLRLETTIGFGDELRSRGVRGTAALRVFTIAQVASAVVVAITSGLLVRSFVQLQGIDRGFDTRNMAVVRLLLPQARYPDARARVAFFETLVPRVAAIPGVVSVAPVHMSPGTGTVGLGATLIFEGQTPEEARGNPWATWEPILPSYFETMGIPIIRGRGFTDADSRDGLPVTIVSEAMARQNWPGQDPIGKRLKFISTFEWATVVGVAADTRYRELTRAWMTVYFPASQFFFFGPGSLVVRTESAPQALIPAIRQTIQSQEPHLAINSISTMDALAAKELSRPRTALVVAALFALMAVILAAVGVYGVVSYEVSQRQRELAVRSALGASPDRIFRIVVWRSVTIGAIGAVVGLVAATLATRSLRVLLFEVSPVDPTTFLFGAGALLAIVLLASYLPARRAAKTDPVVVLRTE